MRRIIPFVLATWLLLPVGVAWSVDGVLEINQTCAVNTGCFPGDAAGFPVTISSSGSYRLTSDLTVTSGWAILSSTNPSNVSIDLNGFTIDGTESTHNGVQLYAGDNWEIRNGTLKGFASAIQQGQISYGHRTIDLRIVGASSRGISLSNGAGHVVRDCYVTGSGGTEAVSVGDDSLVIGNVVTDNTGTALGLDPGTGYANNVINNNGGTVSGGVQMGTNVCDGNTTCP